MTRVRYPLGADEPDAPGSPAGPTSSGRWKTVRKHDPRSIASPGQGLANLYPALYKQAVRCTKYPELPIARLVHSQTSSWCGDADVRTRRYEKLATSPTAAE
jgi:hypothetical protein